MLGIRDMKYKVKLALMAGSAAAGIVLLTVVSLITLGKVEVGSAVYKRIIIDKDALGTFTPSNGTLNEARLTMLRLEDPSNRDKQPMLLDKLRQNEKDFGEAYEHIRLGSLANVKFQELINGPALTIGKDYFSKMNSGYIPLIQAGQFQQAHDYRVSTLVPLIDQQNDAVQKIVDYANERVKENEQDAASSTSTAVWTMVLVCLAVLGLTGLLSVVISSHINTQISKIHAAAMALAEGDLTHRIDVVSSDELGQVGQALNDSFEKVGDAVSEISGHSETIASASEELSSSATQIASSAETQQSQATQVATAMQEMSSTVLQVSDNSNQAADNARRAGDLAKNGGKVVSETVKVIQEVSVSTRDTAAKIEELGRSSDQIGKIINTIDDIADQTNLLALNAAIEAARAGEQGRGFAVVADEVRKLAERTTSATKEIASMIQTIQEETKKAVEAMRSGTAKVDAGVDAANKAGHALQQIIESADSLQDMITHIATAATEQSAATEEINNNMEQISKMVQQSAAGAEESAKACQSLSELSLDLQGVVNKFKIDESKRSTRTRKTKRTKPSSTYVATTADFDYGHDALQ